jgi:hypothetical protein
MMTKVAVAVAVVDGGLVEVGYCWIRRFVDCDL